VVISPRFNWAGDFKGELAPVQWFGKSGFVDKNGLFILNTPFEKCFPFQKNVAVVLHENLWGLIDLNGNLLLPPQFPYFSGSTNGEFFDDMAIFKVDNKFGFVSIKGEIAVLPRYESAGDFSEGLAPVQLHGKYGYINKNDELVIPFMFEDAGLFSEGLAQVKQHKQWGFINPAGEWCVPPKFDQVMPFRNGLAWAEKNTNWVYINKSNDIIWKEPDLYA
jgi:hypothetical protein